MSDPAADLEARLRAARDRLAALERQHEAIVTATRDANTDDEHDPEGSTIAFERAQVEALIGSTRETAARLAAALDEVRAGTYGRCEACGGPIGAERLAARPTATRCIGCAR